MSTDSSPDGAQRHRHTGERPEGRVKPVTDDETTIAVTNGDHHALDTECPHQGGPLGEGATEDRLLRCPWHGWEFYPGSVETHGEFDDCVTSYPVEERDDGVSVGFPVDDPRSCLGMQACDSNKCPAGIATQRTDPGNPLVIDPTADGPRNDVEATVTLMKVMGRACGYDTLSGVEDENLTPPKKEIVGLTGINDAVVGRCT